MKELLKSKRANSPAAYRERFRRLFCATMARFFQHSVCTFLPRFFFRLFFDCSYLLLRIDNFDAAAWEAFKKSYAYFDAAAALEGVKSPVSVMGIRDGSLILRFCVDLTSSEFLFWKHARSFDAVRPFLCVYRRRSHELVWESVLSTQLRSIENEMYKFLMGEIARKAKLGQ